MKLLRNTIKHVASSFLAPILDGLGRALDLNTRLDELTGLPQRAYLVRTLGQLVAEIKPGGRTSSVTVLYLDLNNFKYLNDSYGHETCNELLRAFSARLRQAVGPSACLVRMHGDEFAAVITNLPDEMAATVFAYEICRAVAGHYQIGRERFYLEATIGLAWSDLTQEDLQQQAQQSRGIHMVLVDRADRAMLEAKQVTNVPYRVARFSPEHWDSRLAEHQRVIDLRRAIENGHFTLAYQPLVCLATGRVLGAEVLTRPQGDWQPASLTDDMALLENQAVINELWAAVARRAFADLALWNDQTGCPPLYLSLNISPGQLMSDHAIEVAKQLPLEYGVSPRQIVLELTERQGLGPDEDAYARMSGLRELGYRWVIDDFGQQNGWLDRLLQHDSFTGLKLDQQLVAAMPTNPRAAVLVKWIIDLASTLGMDVTAEGIETADQVKQLVAWGCQTGQGHLFGVPMSRTDFEKHILKQPTSPQPI